jgi:hypothetical protein
LPAVLGGGLKTHFQAISKKNKDNYHEKNVSTIKEEKKKQARF